MKARPKLDHDSGAMITMDSVHSMIHQGKNFITCKKIADTATANFIIDLTGSLLTTETHILMNLTSDANTQVNLLRNPTGWTTTSGSLLTNVNRNEMASNTSSVNIYSYGALTTGTSLVFSDYIPLSSKNGSQITGGSTSARPEFILKPGGSYVLCATMATSVGCTIIFDYYQVEDID